MTILLLTIQALMALVADISLKNGNFLLGITIYAASAIPAYYMYKITPFGLSCVLWSVISLVVGMMMACGYYHEPLSMRRLIGLVLAVAAILIAR